MKTVLTIAGSDCSGGAGIQADLKTFTAHKVYGMSVITALTAQNTLGVTAISEVDAGFVAQQLDCVFQDIPPLAVKIGMVSNIEIIKTIAAKLQEYQTTHIVADPVMVSTSGSKLLSDDAVQTLLEYLLPLAEVITPNLREAEVLWGKPIESKQQMEEAAVDIYNQVGTNVLLKGGHLENCADDLLYDGQNFYWYEGTQIANPNTHGTGCTLSAAIAANLALGFSLTESIKLAKDYISGAIGAQLNLGHGDGPLDHCYRI
jgi:hydroxymethylpyrimidine/phosphomethylpyrimidine kinase